MKLWTKFLVVASLLMLVLAGPFAAAAQDEELFPVTQAGFLVTTMAPVLIALENGYFEDEGIDFEFVEIDSGALGAAAVASGLAQFSDFSLKDVSTMQSQGEDVVMVYNLVNSLTMNLVMRTEVADELGITRESPLEDRFAALSGLTIGITRPGAPTDLYPRWMLQQVGLDPDTSAEFVAIGGGPALLAALETGQIDAYLLSPPTPQIAEAEGFGRIVIMNTSGDVPEFRDYAFTSTVTSRAFAEEHPEIVEAYSRALDSAMVFLKENLDEAAAILEEKYFPTDDFETFKNGLQATVNAMLVEGAFTEQAIINQSQILLDLGELEEMPDTSEGVLWTNAYNPDTVTEE